MCPLSTYAPHRTLTQTPVAGPMGEQEGERKGQSLMWLYDRVKETSWRSSESIDAAGGLRGKRAEAFPEVCPQGQQESVVWGIVGPKEESENHGLFCLQALRPCAGA